MSSETNLLTNLVFTNQLIYISTGPLTNPHVIRLVYSLYCLQNEEAPVDM